MDTPKDPTAKFSYQQGFLAGAKAIRERAAQIAIDGHVVMGPIIASNIRALPIAPEKEKL